jgi:hypothetical protein
VGNPSLRRDVEILTPESLTFWRVGQIVSIANEFPTSGPGAKVEIRQPVRIDGDRMALLSADASGDDMRTRDIFTLRPTGGMFWLFGTADAMANVHVGAWVWACEARP